MKQRVITALVLTPLAIAVILLLPTSGFACVMAALALLGMHEWTRLAGLQSQTTRIAALLVVAAMLGIFWWARDTRAWWLVIAAGALWWLVATAWLRRFSFAAAPTRGNITLKLLAGALTIVPAWTALLEIHAQPTQGPYWALLAVALVWAADTFAFLAGRRWGSKRLAPRISPGKTTAGAWGGLAGAMAIAVAGGWALQQRGMALLALAMLAALVVGASIVGDLFESLLKRHAGVKDSGTLFPGHGGLLDRMDSLFAALPFFALGKLALDLVVQP